LARGLRVAHRRAGRRGLVGVFDGRGFALFVELLGGLRVLIGLILIGRRGSGFLGRILLGRILLRGILLRGILLRGILLRGILLVTLLGLGLVANSEDCTFRGWRAP